MDFVAVILFLVLYFVRVHDWIPMMSGMNVVKPAMLMGLVGLLAKAPRTPPWRFMRTPHEWVMVAFLGYCVYADPDQYTTLTEGIIPLAGIYFLTTYTLTTEKRLVTFLSWWCGCLVFMSLLAVLYEFGIDVTKARDLITENNNRLCLNTYLMDNPNSLGHTAVTALPMLYLLMIFRRDVSMAVMAFPAMMVTAMCVVGTESKGAYLAGVSAIATAFLFGRKASVQIAVIVAMAIIAPTVATMLPRMVDRGDLRKDEGVMGRLMAFEQGHTAYETLPVGWNRFFAHYVWDRQNVVKDAHSAFVKVGADLGPTGLFLYLSALCLAGRSLIRYSTDSDDLERCRRILFVLLVAFVVSGWMINRSYHTEYFLIIAAATSYHRLAIEKISGVEVDFGETPIAARPHTPEGLLAERERAEQAILKAKEFEKTNKTKLWNKYGLMDFGIAYAALYTTDWFWGYIVNSL